MAENTTASESMPATLTFAGQLLQDGKITKDSFELLRSALAIDLAAEARRPATGGIDHSSRVIPGNVTVERHPVEDVWKVFNTAELLEKILSYVPLPALVLSVPLVCRGFYRAIHDSTTLMKLSFRKPDWDASNSVFDFEMSRRNKLVHGICGSPARIEVWPANITQAARSSASLCATFTSQPPTKQATVGRLLRCNGKHNFIDLSFLPPLVLQNSNGITYGHVMDLFPVESRKAAAWCESCRLMLYTKPDIDAGKQNTS